MNNTLEEIEVVETVSPTEEPTSLEQLITVEGQQLQNEVNHLTYQFKVNGEEMSDKDIIELATRNVQSRKKLTELADKVNSLRHDMDNNEVLSRSHGKITLNLALKAGELLNQCQEEMDYENQWETWVKENIKGINVRTVYNYIRLYDHQLKHVSVYKDCDSLREAYIVCGIIKVKVKKDNTNQPTVKIEDGEKEEPDGEPEPESNTVEEPFEKVKRLEQELRKTFIENESIKNYDEMIKLLVPLVTLYQQHQFKQQEQEVTNEVVNG